MFYYDIVHHGAYGKVEEKVTLVSETKYTQEELENLVNKIKKEYYKDKVGKRYKWEAFEYTMGKLHELGFIRKITVDF